MRTLILGVTAVEILIGAILGLVLALGLERSLRQVTGAIYGIASGRPGKPCRSNVRQKSACLGSRFIITLPVLS